jgi:hypothetical protein
MGLFVFLKVVLLNKYRGAGNIGGLIKALNNNQIYNLQNAAKAHGNSKKAKPVQLIVLLFSIMLMLLSCMSETPKDKFHKELNAKIDTLILSLKNFGPGTVEGKAQVESADKILKGSSQISHSLVVASAAKEVYNYLNYMKLDVYEDLKKTGANNPDWVAKLSKDYSSRMLSIKNELEIIKAKVKAAPDAYKISPNLNGVSLGELYSYRTVRIDGNDVVFMTSDNSGIKLTELMNIDMANFLKTLNSIERKQ